MTTGSLYLDSIKVGAIRGWIEERIPASLTGAQAALESGWGTSSLARAPYNNQFGIKASSDWTGRVVNMPTKEYQNGAWVAVNADFRAYDDINDSVADHAKFFTSTEWRKNNYKAVIGETDYKKACYAVKAAGYATDPDYASKLINIIEKYKLYEWDKEAQSGTMPPTSDDVEVVSNLQPKSKIVGGDLSDAGRAFGKQTGVSVIGDSLGVGTEPHLVKLIPNSNYDVKGSRQITHSDSTLNGTIALQNMKNAGNLKQNVVVILGTNRGLTASEIDNFMNICGPERKVLWVETASAVKHNLSANEEMRKAATRHKNAFVLGWYDMVGGLRKEYYGSDDIHMTYMGYFNHAKAIVQGVYEMSTGDFDSSVAQTTTMQFEGIKGFKLSEDGKLEYTDENKVKQVIQTEFRGLSTDGKTNYIYNVSANNAYNPQTGATEADWLEGRFESSDLKGLDLFMAACRDMMNRGEPEATYRVVLSELPKGIEIGAEGTIVDTASNPPRYITARVSEITTSQTNPEYNEVVITNVVEVKPFEKPTTLLIQEELRKNRDKLNTDYKERILESDLNSMGGLVLATEDSETTLIADVELDGENVTEHYSDFRWERQSNNAESDKLYNEILSKTESGMTLNVSDKDIEGEESNFICRIYDDAGNLVRTIMKKMVSQVKIKKEIDAANEALEQSIATAEQNAQDALTKAGASEDLANTAKEVSESALANIGTVEAELHGVKTQASDSLTKAQEALNAAGTLSTQVQSYEETVDGYKSEVANYSRTNETLTAQVKTYEESVDGYSQSLTRVEGKVDGIKIGGNNLLIGTSSDWKDLSSDGIYWNAFPNYSMLTLETLGVVVGDEVVFSGMLEAGNSSACLRVTMYIDQANYHVVKGNYIPSNQQGLSVVKTKIPTDIKSITFGFDYMNAGVSKTNIRYKELQFEKGNIRTDWTLSEKEKVTQSEYTVYKNTVKSTTDEHTRRLTALDGTDGRVTKVEQTANGIKQSLTDYAKKTYVDTTVETTAKGINTQITNIEKTIPTSFEGRNLQSGSNDFSVSKWIKGHNINELWSGPIEDNWTRVIANRIDNNSLRLLVYPLDLSEIEIGEKFSVSFDFYSNAKAIPYFNVKGMVPIDQLTWSISREGSQVAKRIKITGVRSTYMTTRTELSFEHDTIYANYDFNIRYLKVEKGIIPTEWTPHISDNISRLEFQKVQETSKLYERVIGTTETDLKSNIGRIVLTDSLFQTEVSKNTDLTNTKSQVTQLSNSWALTLKSGNDIKTAINATTDGIRLKGSLITLDGLVNMTSSFIVPEGNIGNLSAKKITSNHAELVSAGFQSLNSNLSIDGGAIRIQNNDGDFATMNAIPEFRSQDNAGTAAILGKGRSQYYSNNQSRFYIGSSLSGDEVEGKVVHGVHISKGQTWGIYRQSDAFGGTPAQYHIVKSGESWRSITNKYLGTNASVDILMQLNGYNVNNYPGLQPGDTILIKTAVPGNSSGIERIWTMGTSSNGDTRTYSHVHHVFEGGTTGVSDARLKHDIKPTEIKALDHIADLSFKQFKWNKNDALEPLGLIAQESGILRVPDEEVEGIDIQRAMMLALKGIQELSQKVQELGA